MVQLAEPRAVRRVRRREFATFYVGDALLGIDICTVQEINRNIELSIVPHAPTAVSGVMNLRGEVCTVLDLRAVFGMPPRESTQGMRNIVVTSGDERIGLLIDRIADVVTASDDDIEPPPGNLNGLEDRFFSGVYKLDNDLLLLLNTEEVLA